jgi:hypothetical protein
MELLATETGPRYMSPTLTPHQQWRQRVTGLADEMILGPPAVDHDAAANPPLSARIDLLL